MKCKIVEEVKLVSYTEAETSNMPCIPYTHLPILITIMTFSRGVDVSELSASVKSPNLTYPTILHFIRKTVVIFVTFGKMQH